MAGFREGAGVPTIQEMSEGSTDELVARRPQLDHAEHLDPGWNPRFPELAFAVDGVSLLMPYAEPYFVRTVRAALPELEPGLRATAAAFCAQEARHHAEHRRFNDLLAEGRPGVRRLEGWIDRTYRWVERRGSLRFNLAFAAASETIAFSIARWADRHHHELFDGVDADTATLFQWHLAEEVEHKSVAFDVHRALDRSRLRHAWAATATFAILAWFTVLTVLALMASTGRWRSPGCWLRLPRWAFAIGFTTLPDLAVSLMASHHPSRLADPPGLESFLRGYDAERAARATAPSAVTPPSAMPPPTAVPPPSCSPPPSTVATLAQHQDGDATPSAAGRPDVG